MKLVREYINEKFVEDSDPVKDMGIGLARMIKKWLDERLVHDYKINDDLTIDVDNNLELLGKIKENFPKYIQFGKVSGYVNIGDNDMTSLRGCPQEMGDFFTCTGNKLTSLKDGPISVFTKKRNLQYNINNKYGYQCSHNQLSSLEGLPKEINGWLWIHDNAKVFSEKEIRLVCNVKGPIEF
jgi:hypothetical protein